MEEATKKEERGIGDGAAERYTFFKKKASNSWSCGFFRKRARCLFFSFVPSFLGERRGEDYSGVEGSWGRARSRGWGGVGVAWGEGVEQWCRL